jgi:hypothetical protein
MAGGEGGGGPELTGNVFHADFGLWIQKVVLCPLESLLPPMTKLLAMALLGLYLEVRLGRVLLGLLLIHSEPILESAIYKLLDED